MKSYKIIFLSFLFLSRISFCICQNLVPNPSFENFNPCPSGNSQIANATPWDRPPGSITSPDLFNACNAGAGCGDVQVPANFAGTLGNPFHGSTYAGILTFYTGCTNCREYITAPFTTPLAANTQYCVSFRVMRGSWARYASNNLGAYISNGPPTQPSNQPILVTPQVEITSVVYDSASWTLVSGTYTAVGGETNITIGNFHDNSATAVYDYGFSPGTCALAYAAAYYFIDSVFVGTCSVSSQPPVANFTANSTNICAGDCINFTDQSTNIPTSWNWNFPGGNPASSSSQNPSNICYNTPGTYTVLLTASNSNGSDTATTVITVNPLPTANAGADVSICYGFNTSLNASGGISYLWSPSTSLSNPNISNPIASPTSTATYTVTVTDLNGCTNTDAITVTVNPLPVANAGTDVTICNGNNTSLNASGGISYLWSPSTSLTNPNISNPIASPTSTTTYTVTVTDLNGCSNTDIVTITVNPQPTVNAGADVTICPGDAVTLSASGNGNYSWSTGQTTSSINVNPTSTTSYTVAVSNSCGSSTDAVNVVVSNFITASVSGNSSICTGQTATLTASGGTSFTWSTGATTATINTSAAGNYSVIVSSGNCSDTAFVTVTVSSPPIASVSGNATICAGESITLTASGGGNYSWNTGTTTSSISVSPTSTTTYSVIVSVGGCFDTASATVTVNPIPTVNAGNNITITEGQSVTLSASGNSGSYSWSNGMNDTTITVSPSATTLYCVTVTDLNGCTASSCVTIFVELICSGELYLPNAFSPNGDGENDELKIHFGKIECIEKLNIVIYNRWGEKVFQSSNPDFRWDGKDKTGLFKGKEGSAVFVYTLNVEMLNGEIINRKGNISLVR